METNTIIPTHHESAPIYSFQDNVCLFKEISTGQQSGRLTDRSGCLTDGSGSKRKLSWQIQVRLISKTRLAELKAAISKDFAQVFTFPHYLPISAEAKANAALDVDIAAIILVRSQVNDGKIAKKDITIVISGKNLGKKNATNVFTQALKDANGLYQKYFKKSGSAGGTKMPPPMLAKVYEESVSSSIPPIFVQPKYNGLRAIAHVVENNTLGPHIEFYSRGNTVYPDLTHISIELAAAFKDRANLYLDGELFAENTPLQTINSLVRGTDKSNPEVANVKFYIYDCFDTGRPEMLFAERAALIHDLFTSALSGAKSCVKVATYKCANGAQIDTLYRGFLEQKFEGAMIRLNGPYVHSFNGYRSNYLFKLKPTLDAEFKIIGFTSGIKGKGVGAIVFICETAAGIAFNVTPAREVEERKKMFAKFSADTALFDAEYLGKSLIVYFAELSTNGVPLQPRTELEIREWA